MADKQPAHPILFPLAATYAMLAVPASLWAMRSGAGWPPGLATPAGHGHEMLFGFALAVVAGFVATRITRAWLSTLVGLWLLARGSYLVQPAGLLAAAANAGFAVTIAWLAAPQLIRAAKKRRNQLFGPLLIVLACAVVGFHAAVLASAPHWQGTLLEEGVLLFALLMFFMGGRIIAPAAAGHLQHIGERLEARVQPRLEGTTLALLLAASALAPLPGGDRLAAVPAFAAGVAAAVRVARWRLWRCRGRPDLIGLGIGYAWLAIGLMLMGVALAMDAWRITDALHALTVGAVGSLTIAVMARTRLLWAKRDPARPRGVPLAIGLIGIAALARLTAPAWPLEAWHAYWAAAAAWALAYLLLIQLLLRTGATRARRDREA